MKKVLLVALCALSFNLFAQTTFNSDGTIDQTVPDANGNSVTFHSDGSISQTFNDGY